MTAKIKDDCRMTRKTFADSPAYVLLNLNKPIEITHSGQVQWIALDKKKYDALIDKLTELATGGRR